MKTYALLALALVSSVTAMPASAATLLFSFASNLGTAHDFSFSLDSSPSIASSSSAGFDVSGVALTYGGSPYTDVLSFYTASATGGMSDIHGQGLFDLYGPTVFSGPTSAPTFAPGSFTLNFATGAPEGILTISSVSGVPEPLTWMMMLLGFGAIGVVVRRRKSTHRTTQFV